MRLHELIDTFDADALHAGMDEVLDNRLGKKSQKSIGRVGEPHLVNTAATAALNHFLDAGGKHEQRHLTSTAETSLIASPLL